MIGFRIRSAHAKANHPSDLYCNFLVVHWCSLCGPVATGGFDFTRAGISGRNKKGRTARVAELLKQYPAVINSSTKNGTTPVLLAIYAQHPEIAEALLATGIKPNIFEAAATGRVGRVKELINTSPALVKAHSPDGWTALHLNFGNLEIVKVLLDSGSDINAVSKNAFSASPLQGAAAFHKIELARLLIARGANVNCCAAEGGTPLHETAGSGQVEFAKLLLEHGANINAKDEHGKTPLA